MALIGAKCVRPPKRSKCLRSRARASGRKREGCGRIRASEFVANSLAAASGISVGVGGSEIEPGREERECSELIDVEREWLAACDARLAASESVRECPREDGAQFASGAGVAVIMGEGGLSGEREGEEGEIGEAALGGRGGEAVGTRGIGGTSTESVSRRGRDMVANKEPK